MTIFTNLSRTLSLRKREGERLRDYTGKEENEEEVVGLLIFAFFWELEPV